MTAVIVAAVVAVILLYIIYSTVEFGMLYKVFGVLYIEVVTIMTAIALGNLFAKGTLFWTMFAVGAVLFTASDVMMVLNARIRNGFLRFMNLSLYYVGQLLIALSLYFIE